MKKLSEIISRKHPGNKCGDGTGSTRAPSVAYSGNLAAFDSFYLELVIFTVALMAISVAVAVIKNILIGICVASVSVFIYRYFSSDEMYKRLGLLYFSDDGELKITGCRAVYGDTFYLPRKVMWYDVAELSDGAFRSAKNAELSCVYLPSTLKRLGKNVFDGCPRLTVICFEGSREQWEQIENSAEYGDIQICFNAEFPKKARKEKQIGKETAASDTKMSDGGSEENTEGEKQ